SAGMFSNMRSSASNPPAEAPIPTTCVGRFEWVCAVGLSGFSCESGKGHLRLLKRELPFRPESWQSKQSCHLVICYTPNNNLRVGQKAQERLEPTERSERPTTDGAVPL